MLSGCGPGKRGQQHDVATLDIAEVGQALFEQLRELCSASLGRKGQHMAYAPELAGLLSSGTKGQRQSSTADCANKIATPHSITSSASASSAAGRVRPRALAAFRLMTSSYLVGR